MKLPKILAIDTSCDDTSAAVTQGTTVLSNVIASQTELHRPYGGVFPTIAKVAHKENIARTIQVALQRANVGWDDISAIAVTIGPGLAPALEVGIAHAQLLAAKHHKPLLPVNHIAGHLLSVLAEPNSSRKKTVQADNQKRRTLPQNAHTAAHYPALSVIVSGKHTEFVLVTKIGQYQVLGSTLDDAAGECLDKIGRMLNLGYPAAPVIEQFAKLGNAQKYEFPLPLTTVKTFDLSFSGLKTFARNFLEAKTKDHTLTQQEVYDLCASVQFAVFRHICYKLAKILEVYPVREVWLGGGVAANMTLRSTIRATIRKVTKKLAKQGSEPEQPIRFRAPYTKKLCMDNAAMIGVAAGFYTISEDQSKNLKKLERQPRLHLG